MKYSWLFAALIFTAPLSALNLGNLVYDLPASVKDWAVYQKTESPVGVNVIYAPKTTNKNDTISQPTESFVVSLTTQPISISDIETIASNIKKNLPPDANVKVNMVEKSTDAMIYEWSITDGSGEKAHGWTRAFELKNGGTAIIQYITENVSDIENARTVWLPVIKAVKIDPNLPNADVSKIDP